MTNKEIKEYFDLYDWSILVHELKKRYMFVSYAPKSVPTLGSNTKRTKFLREDVDVKTHRVINHRNDRITLVTERGYYQFLN